MADKETDEFFKANFADGTLKKCPRGCIVEKISGCNYIECICAVKFCWNCNKEKGPEKDQCNYGNTVCGSH